MILTVFINPLNPTVFSEHVTKVLQLQITDTNGTKKSLYEWLGFPSPTPNPMTALAHVASIAKISKAHATKTPTN